MSCGADTMAAVLLAVQHLGAEPSAGECLGLARTAPTASGGGARRSKPGETSHAYEPSSADVEHGPWGLSVAALSGWLGRLGSRAATG